MPTESLYPNGEFSKTNFTGTYLDVATEVATPGTDWMDPTDDGTNNAVTFNFETPTDNLTAGVGLQTIKVWVRKQVAAGNNPAMLVEVRQAGNVTPLATLVAAETITSDTGEQFTYTFNANILAAASGVDFELHFAGARSGGSPTLRRNLSIGAVEWVADYTAAGGFQAAWANSSNGVI